MEKPETQEEGKEKSRKDELRELTSAEYFEDFESLVSEEESKKRSLEFLKKHFEDVKKEREKSWRFLEHVNTNYLKEPTRDDGRPPIESNLLNNDIQENFVIPMQKIHALEKDPEYQKFFEKSEKNIQELISHFSQIANKYKLDVHPYDTFTVEEAVERIEPVAKRVKTYYRDRPKIKSHNLSDVLRKAWHAKHSIITSNFGLEEGEDPVQAEKSDQNQDDEEEKKGGNIQAKDEDKIEEIKKLTGTKYDEALENLLAKEEQVEEAVVSIKEYLAKIESLKKQIWQFIGNIDVDKFSGRSGDAPADAEFLAGELQRNGAMLNFIAPLEEIQRLNVSKTNQKLLKDAREDIESLLHKLDEASKEAGLDVYPYDTMWEDPIALELEYDEKTFTTPQGKVKRSFRLSDVVEKAWHTKHSIVSGGFEDTEENRS